MPADLPDHVGIHGFRASMAYTPFAEIRARLRESPGVRNRNAGLVVRDIEAIVDPTMPRRTQGTEA
jgi:hypothetical protein